jgi:hypothetical protein
MDTTTAPFTAHSITTAASSRRMDIGRFAVTLLLGAALGAVVTIAVMAQPRVSSATAPLAGTAVTDGWAHSPITRGGSANVAAGTAITDGWAHSPITREGGSDVRAALLRQFAASYEAQGPAAEARSR